MYTFGSPRVGNEEFSDYFYSVFPDHTYYRVVHYNELVPHIPPSLIGYKHVGDEAWYISKDYD